MAHGAHDEFPLLTPRAHTVIKAAQCSFPSTFVEGAGVDVGERRFAAAVLREAMTQTGTWKINSEFPKVIDAKELEAIADNLHSPLPTPPTPEQMVAILNDLAARYSDKLGPEWVSNPFEALRRGIAHHCQG